MRWKLTALVALAAAAVTVVSLAVGAPVAGKQRVLIERSGTAPFVLTPQTPGALKGDTGVASFCCWTSRYITREGEKIEVSNPRLTLAGKSGTLVVSNRMEWADAPGGYALFTGTWKVISGTGAYAGLTGGGRVAGVVLPNGQSKWRRVGTLSPK